ncbi:MAG: sigma-54 dependent transcriptional regulator [Thermoanaerobaculia bacterium]|nr:sigma-54 dependent transcriptional regulator [Thermoanaerobaculia bacterium]
MTPPAEPSGHPSVEELFSRSPVLGEAMEGLLRAARSEAPILLLGEAGSGRSTLARAVHASSSRADELLVEIDSGSIPVSLFESELFGHRRGAFTGAETSREGKVERAEGGSLLLDQVEEIPRESQPKLLRFLSERRFQPLGGRERKADVRFLAVGTLDLPDRVEQGVFRSDLYYRLEVLAFRVPPLRERREDLPALCRRMIADVARRLGVEPKPLSEATRSWMSDYPWPGNLRELRNLLERSLILSRGEELDPDPPREPGEDRPRTLQEVEIEEIRKALAYTRGHQGRAAELLGISRKGLWAKRKRYGIP